MFAPLTHFLPRRFAGPWTQLAALTLLVLSTSIASAATDKPLMVGIFPRFPALQTQRMFQPMMDQLARALDRKIVLEVPPDFTAFRNRVNAGRYELLHYNPYDYVRAHQELGHVAIARNIDHGSSELRAAIWVRRDSPARTLSDLVGSKIVFGGGRTAMVSHIMAADLLLQAGLTPADYVAGYTINPSRALLAVYYHQSRAAGSLADASANLPLGADIEANALRPLAVSEPVAEHPWAVAASVNVTDRERIRQALLALSQTQAGREALAHARLTGLTASNDHDYDPHRRIIARVLGEHY